MTKALSCFFNTCRRSANAARKGTTAVEMALIAPVFFLLLMGVIELGLMFGAQELMENAAYNTSRLAKTGYTASGQTQTQTVNQVMINELQSYGTLFTASKITVTETAYNSFSSIGSGGTAGYGTAQQIVVYKITYPWTLFTPMLSLLMGAGGIVNLTSTIVVRNEPYS